MTDLLIWQLVPHTRSGQLVADDGQGGGLAINESTDEHMRPAWWLSGPNYGPGTRHSSLDEAKAVAQRWRATGSRPAATE